MKLTNFLLFSLTAVAMTSCVAPGYSGGRTYSSARVNYGYYDSVPSSYVGDAYYHDGRYYYGGRYESGRYYDNGRTYNDRYYHNGNYYYGGSIGYYGR